MAGCILRFDDGTIMKGFTHFLDESSTDSLAEGTAMLCGILLTIDMDFTSFMIQSDSLVVVSMIHGSFTVPWRLDNIVRRIHILISEYHVSFER